MIPQRPAWQTEPCPAWCVAVGEDCHQTDHYADDRTHFSEHTRVNLTTMDMWQVGRHEFELDHARLWLEQGYREVGPRIGLGQNEKPGMKLTIGEAIQLIDELRRLVDELRRLIDVAEGHAEAG